MAVFRCTKKLLTELKIRSVPEISDEDMLSSWHVNIFNVERRKCLLFTHSETLYSVFVGMIRKPHLDNIDTVFRKHLYQALVYDEFTQIQTEHLMNAQRNFTFTKTNSRSVLASMNDQVNGVWWAVTKSGGIINADPAWVAMRVNRRPMGGLNMLLPNLVMREYIDQHLSSTGYQLPDRRVK